MSSSIGARNTICMPVDLRLKFLPLAFVGSVCFCSAVLDLPNLILYPKNLASDLRAFVITVFSSLSVRSSLAFRNCLTFSLISSARRLGPVTPTTQSSA